MAKLRKNVIIPLPSSGFEGIAPRSIYPRKAVGHKGTQRRREEHSSELDICQFLTLIDFYQLAHAQNEY